MKTARFCAECGTQFLEGAAFCHNCGLPVSGEGAPAGGMSPLLKWGVPAAAILALVLLSIFRMGARDAPNPAGAVPLASTDAAMPDISTMTPTQRADRLFNRVMRLWSEGKTDSAAFFAPMAVTSFEALAPLDAHLRYDLGLVALVAGDVAKASAQSDTILAGRQNHLLGLVLAARVADARGDAEAGRAVRQRLVESDSSERRASLPEYVDHDADLKAAVEAARR